MSQTDPDRDRRELARGRRFAEDEGLAPRRQRWLFEKKLGQPPAAGLDLVAIKQCHGRHQFGRSDVQADGHTLLDRPFHVGQAVQPHRQHPGWHQVTRRRKFLAAPHVLMAHPGQVYGRAHAAMDLVHNGLVGLQ